MVRHKYWRIIAITLVIILFILLLNHLFSNARERMNQFYTGNLAYYTAESIIRAKLETVNVEETDVQQLLTGIQELIHDIRSIAVVEGRTFLAHSDPEQVGERITKDLFDTLRQLQQNAVDPEQGAPYVIWKESQDSPDLFNLYYPIYQDGKVTGMVFINLPQQTIHPVDISGFFIILFFALLFLVIVILDLTIPRINVMVGPLLFLITILILTGYIEAKFERDLQIWNQQQAEIFAGMDAAYSEMGLEAVTAAQDLELPLHETINIWKVTLSFLGILLMLFILSGLMEKFFDSFIEHRLAYGYILPAMFGVFLLVFFPFIYGFLIGFTDYNLTNFGGDLIEYFSDLKNYGFDNFYNILRVINFKDYSNFYFTLTHTIIWTVLNLIFHVGIGVALALLLNDERLRGRTIFRVLLILPWAIPNYITALIWRGMFHKQFGAVNGLLEMLGFQSISWFTQPGTAFLANLATNVWLGFPFMMIIALGALQSIPKELYEASAIDGSSRWQSFWNVTFPLLKPAMVPAIILGTIWTFNQFNVIYLVSGGGPDGATELLITDAYKLAFEQYRYGYAAAYCIIIFLVLFTYGVITSKVTKATKGVYE